MRVPLPCFQEEAWSFPRYSGSSTSRELVTKSKNLGVEFGTVPKGGGEQSQECDENGVHGGSEHDLNKDHNLYVSNAEEVFGNRRH